MSYDFLRTIHVSFVVLTFISFSLRAIWMLQESAMLRRKLVKILPHVIDTVLLASAIALLFKVQQYPLSHPWITAKVVALVAYIILGMVALKRGKTRNGRILALIGAYAVFFYILLVALTRDPLPTL
ncbi:MAG: SirB2 family protein [Acidiferrobacterales bacterium]